MALSGCKRPSSRERRIHASGLPTRPKRWKQVCPLRHQSGSHHWLSPSLLVSIRQLTGARFQVFREQVQKCRVLCTTERVHARKGTRLSSLRNSNPGRLAQVKRVRCWRAPDPKADTLALTRVPLQHHGNLRGIDSFSAAVSRPVDPSRPGWLSELSGSVRKSW